MKDWNFVPQVHFFQLSLLYSRKASGRMPTVTGYPIPIPADELVSFNGVFRAIQMSQRAQGECSQCWEPGANLNTYTSVAIMVFLFHEYCEHNIRTCYWGWIAENVMASSYSRSRGSTSFLIPFLCTWQFVTPLRSSTSGYILYTFRLTWLTQLLQKRLSWKASTLLYVFMRISVVCTASAAIDRLG